MCINKHAGPLGIFCIHYKPLQSSSQNLACRTPMTSFRTQFAVVDQALKHLKTVEDYLNVGMDTTSSVATDLAETEKGKNYMD